MTAGARAVLAVLLVVPGAAFAHSPIKGTNDFYNGLLHPVFVPAHVLSLLALGLLFGQQGPKELEAAVVAFFAATVAGLAAAWLSLGTDVGTALLLAAVLIGLLIAVHPRVPVYRFPIISAFTGFAVGMDSAQEGLTGTAGLIALLGSGIGIYLLVLYAMGFAEYFSRQPWQRTGIRILGSWIAASAFLVLSLELSSAAA